MPAIARRLATSRLFVTLITLVAISLLFVNSAFAARAGNKEIAAHGGDREAKPSTWKESEWENSVQAIGSAFNRGVRWVEIDAQLNRHPNAITASTPYGILYTHHDARCEEINSSGQGTGVWRNIATDDPSLVDRCAERMANIFNRWPYANRYIVEMKGDTGYTTDLPKALYHLLKAKGWRTSVIVSSLNRNMLYTIQDAGWADGVNVNLMQVYGATISPSANEIAIVKQLGFRYINVNVNDWTFSTVNYAKDIGLYVVGWHWQLTSCESANDAANGYDLDIMMTDCIGHLQAKGWF